MRFFDFFTIVYDVVFVVQLLSVSFSLVWVFYPWAKNRKNILIGIAHLVALFAAGTVLNWLLFALSAAWRGIAGLHFAIAWLITVLLYLVYVRAHDRVHITSLLVMGATLFITVITTTDLGREIMYCFISATGKLYDLFCFVSFALMVAFGFIMRHYSLVDYSDIPRVSVVMIMINTVVSLVLNIVITELKMQSGFGGDAFYCLVYSAVYVVSITGYMMIYFHCKAYKENMTLGVQNKLLEADKQMLTISEQAIEEMRSLRHDMKNQHKVMSLMIEQNKFDEMKEYFASMSDKLDYSCLSEFIDCGNKIINSIVNMEILKATSHGVKLLTKINVPPELPFELSDICRVLVNLLDNAIEGILRTESRDHIIDLKIGKRAEYLYICVQNEIRNDADRAELLKMNTVKNDAANHGFGHKIVKRIVEKYNGYVNYSIEDSDFIAEAMLDMNMASAAAGGSNA